MAGPAGTVCSGWKRAEHLFTTPEFQRRYDTVDISLLTPKVALVPEGFFSPEQARQALSQAACLPGASVHERVRLFRAAEAPRERETLVLASEKHFLFFGGAQ